jgi:hypothetical protein
MRGHLFCQIYTFISIMISANQILCYLAHLSFEIYPTHEIQDGK